jgi:hypothetical protein
MQFWQTQRSRIVYISTIQIECSMLGERLHGSSKLLQEEQVTVSSSLLARIEVDKRQLLMPSCLLHHCVGAMTSNCVLWCTLNIDQKEMEKIREERHDDNCGKTERSAVTKVILILVSRILSARTVHAEMRNN